MSKSALRKSIIQATLFTAIVHLVVLNIVAYRDHGSLDPLFTLNGLGYLGLLWLFVANPAIVAGRRSLLHYAYMLYAATTVVAFFIVGDMGDWVGWTTKGVELILIVALWKHQGME